NRCNAGRKFSSLPDESSMNRLLPFILLAYSALGQTALHLKTLSPERTAEMRVLTSPQKRRALMRSHLIIQYPNTPTDAQLAQLQDRGVATLGYIPDFGLAVSADDGTTFDDLGLRWYGRLEAAEKLSSQFADSVSADGAGHFVVEFYSDID